MTFDLVLSQDAEEFLASIERVDRERFFKGLSVLALDPFPDGRTKVKVQFPFRPGAGVVGTTFGDFWIAYKLGTGCLTIVTVAWSPESGRAPGSGQQ